MTTTYKTFYASRQAARHSGLSVKDAGAQTEAGKRWYTESTVSPAKAGQTELQAIFDKAAKHLLKQGKRSESVGAGAACLYRGPNKTMCAAGVFISDENYSTSLENKTVRQDPVIEALKLSGFPNTAESFGLLRRLQNIHDIHTPSSWKINLKSLATKYNLNTDALN